MCCHHRLIPRVRGSLAPWAATLWRTVRKAPVRVGWVTRCGSRKPRRSKGRCASFRTVPAKDKGEDVFEDWARCVPKCGLLKSSNLFFDLSMFPADASRCIQYHSNGRLAVSDQSSISSIFWLVCPQYALRPHLRSIILISNTGIVRPGTTISQWMTFDANTTITMASDLTLSGRCFRSNASCGQVV